MSNLNNVVRTEFAAAINQIASERKIPAESIYEAIRQALVSAFRKQIGELEEESYYYVELNEDTGEARILKAPVLERDEETEEITKWDEAKSEDVTPAGFGRIAAQTAKQVILQKIRRSEKDQIISDYSDKIGEIITGQVLRMSGRSVVLDIGRGQGWMPPEEQMRGEFYRLNMRVAVIVKEIQDTPRGQNIIVSRADSSLVSKLFEREVPEVSSGAVEVVSIAREAGVRTKLTVRSTQDGVDPVGSCVGQRGVRVQKVIEELNNEKIDIIPFSEDKTLFMQSVLAPAEGLQIEYNEAEMTVEVTCPDDQLSLAIGRGGQNVRLAAKLTGYKITVKSASGTVKSTATGDEEYEIDTFKEMNEETRAMLIQNKLTTLNDLMRFRDKLDKMEDLAEDQKEMLITKIKAGDKEEAERSAERRAMYAESQATSESTETTDEATEESK